MKQRVRFGISIAMKWKKTLLHMVFSPPSLPCMSDSSNRRREDVKCWKCIDVFKPNCSFNTDKVEHKRKVCFCPHSQEPWCEVVQLPTESQPMLTCQAAVVCLSRLPDAVGGALWNLLLLRTSWPDTSALRYSGWVQDTNRLVREGERCLDYKRDTHSLIRVDQSEQTCSLPCSPYLGQSLSSVICTLSSDSNGL